MSLEGELRREYQENTMGRPLPGQELTFSESEYQIRLNVVQRDLSRRQLAGGILFDPENIYWLTGFQTIGYFTFQCLLVLADDKPILVSRQVNGFLAAVTPTLSRFEGIEDHRSPIDVLLGLVNGLFPDGEAIGIETGAWYMTVRDYLELKGGCVSELVQWNDHIEPFRIIKSEGQVSRMRKAARAAEAGLDAALAAVRVGASENDLAAAMHSAAIGAGSEYLGHPPLVVSGERTALCFATWKRRVLKKGDVVLLESAGCIDRYHAIVARSAVVGKANSKQRDMSAVILEVLEQAISSIRPGVTSAEVDSKCREIAEKNEVSGRFAHRTGYAIGIGFPPNWSEGRFLALRPEDPTVLKAGMTFHCVPTLFDDEYGMCFSESVLVTDHGCEVLTQYPRKLFEISG
jgi:Xaa-Pro dipeptidase